MHRPIHCKTRDGPIRVIDRSRDVTSEKMAAFFNRILRYVNPMTRALRP
jgi:hypothetical protein